MPYFGVTGTVTEESHWAELLVAEEARALEALVEWGELTKEQIRTHETRIGTADPFRRVWPGQHLRDSFRVGKPLKAAAGWIIRIYSPDPNNLWQNNGTRRGVSPLQHMERGLEAALPFASELFRAALNRL